MRDAAIMLVISATGVLMFWAGMQTGKSDKQEYSVLKLQDNNPCKQEKEQGLLSGDME